MSLVFHAGDTGSNPVGDANITHRKDREAGMNRLPCFLFITESRAPERPLGGREYWIRLRTFKNPGMESFEIIGEVMEIEVIAVGSAIREIG